MLTADKRLNFVFRCLALNILCGNKLVTRLFYYNLKIIKRKNDKIMTLNFLLAQIHS